MLSLEACRLSLEGEERTPAAARGIGSLEGRGSPLGLELPVLVFVGVDWSMAIESQSLKQLQSLIINADGCETCKCPVGL